MSRSYTIHMDGRRLWTIGAIPIPDLTGINSLCRATLGRKLVVVSDVAAKLDASLAICPKSEMSAWRADLGLAEK